MKFIVLPAMLFALSFNLSCSSNYTDDKEKEEAIKEAQEEKVEVDKDAFGDDEIELND